MKCSEPKCGNPLSKKLALIKIRKGYAWTLPCTTCGLLHDNSGNAYFYYKGNQKYRFFLINGKVAEKKFRRMSAIKRCKNPRGCQGAISDKLAGVSSDAIGESVFPCNACNLLHTTTGRPVMSFWENGRIALRS